MVMRILPQVAEQPGQSPAGQIQASVTPMRDATGSQIANLGMGLVDTGQQLTAAADRFQDNLDLAKSAEAENRLRDVIREQLEAPGAGYFHTVGMDASAERRKKAFDAIEVQRRTIDAGLLNAAQKGNFRDQANRMLAEVTARADQHQQEQVVNYRLGQLKARSVNSLEEAAKLAGTEKGEVAKLSALRDIDDHGILLGWPDEAIHQEKLRATTQLHSVVANGLMTNGGGAAAQSYVEQNANEIASSRLAELRGATRTAAVQDHAARLELQLAEEARTGAGAVVSSDGVEIPVDTWANTEAAARGEKLPDAPVRAPLVLHAMQRLDDLFEKGAISAEVRRATMAAVRQRVDTEDQARAQEADGVTKSAMLEATQRRARSVEELHPTTQTALNRTGTSGRLQLWLDRGEQRITTARGHAAIEATSDEALLRFPTAEQLLQVYHDDLSTADEGKLAARWRQARKQASDADRALLSRDKLLRQVAREAGILPRDTDPTDEQKTAFEDFEIAVGREAVAKAKSGEVSSSVYLEVARAVARDTIAVDGVQVPFLTATREQQNRGSFTTSTGRQVYNRNLPEDTKAQILEAIDIYNAEAAKRNATLPPDQQVPLKPREMKQVAEEWEQANIRRRADDAQRVQQITGDAFKDADVFRAYFRLHAWNYRDDARALRTLESTLSNPRLREEFIRYEGLTDDQLAALVRVLEAKAGAAR